MIFLVGILNSGHDGLQVHQGHVSRESPPGLGRNQGWWLWADTNTNWILARQHCRIRLLS